MNRSKKYMMAAALATLSCGAMAQGLNTGYFIDGYAFRHNLNPAYGNDQNYVSIPALGNIQVRTQGNFGLGDVLFDNPRYGIDSDKKKTTFMNPYIADDEALKGFASGNNRINADVDITLLSAGFKAWGGYNTISLDARTNVGLSLPYELFAFAKNTGNQSYDIGDIHAHAQSFVQLALGHSRQIDDRLRVGAKMKLLFGVARADAEIKDLRADLSGPDKWTMTGQAMANVSMKGFTYKEEQKEYKVDGQGTYRRVNDVDVDGAGLGGFGMAFDFGATYKIDDDWTVSAALLDLGFIGWSNNMQAVNRQTSFEFNGFHDVAVKKEDAMGNPKDNSLESQGDRYADQIADFANLSSDGDKGSRSTGIGATMNFGCEYTLPAYRQLKFGFLSSTRINGKYSWTDARLSANVAPLSWLDGGMSFSELHGQHGMGHQRPSEGLQLLHRHGPHPRQDEQGVYPPQFQCQSEPRYERHLLIVSYGSPRRRPGMISHSCARHQPPQAVGGRIPSSAIPSFCPVFSVAIFLPFPSFPPPF